MKAVVRDGFDQIAVGWKPLFANVGYRLDLTSVFTHCRPHVTAPLGTCELADLLIVVDECAQNGDVRDRRATLVQAKTLKGPSIKLSKKEKVQFDLLFGWPIFSFEDAAYDERPRNFRDPNAPGDSHFSGEYGAIDLRPSPRTWTQLLTQGGYTFSGDHPLGDYLVQMTCGRDAFGREAVKDGTDDWSFTVDELLKITAAFGMTKGDSIARGNTHTLGMITGISRRLSASGGPPPSDEGDDEEWGEGPLSIVRVAATPTREGHP